MYRIVRRVGMRGCWSEDLEGRGAIEVLIERGFSGSVQGGVWFGDGVHTVGRCGDLYKFLRRLREELQTFEHTSRPSLCHVWG